MEMFLWQILLIAFGAGAVAAFVSQYATAGRAVAANAEARALRQNLEHLRERNARRRRTLDERQGILDEYRRMKIAGENIRDGAALDEAIQLESARIDDLRHTILDTEKIITEYDNSVAQLHVEKARSTWWLVGVSTIIGGATSLIFGFINFLGAETNSLTWGGPVNVTSSVIVQSVALGAGWPLVWERFLGEGKLEAVTSAAAARFESSVRNAERAEV